MHLVNYNVTQLGTVSEATDISIKLPLDENKEYYEIRIHTPDTEGDYEILASHESVVGDELLLEFTVPNLQIYGVVEILYLT